MKKYLVIIAIAIISGLILSSCKGSERCPAYGQAEESPADQNA